MRLGAETGHLLQKRYKQALQPGEIVISSLLTTFTFAVVHLCCSSGIRYEDRVLSVSVILLFVVLCLVLFVVAQHRHRNKRPFRSWLTAAVCCSAAAAGGVLLGEKSWFQYSAQYFVYSKMASYVNIDPSVDHGRAYMDAGTVYFKEGSFVDSKKAIAFHNGLTYCVAPIVRGNESQQKRSVDFWAVGVDCCGDAGERFRCGDVSTKTRSGLRLLDDTNRAMYMLGVQEWSATTGIFVEHPVFFRWTRDPLAYRQDLYEQGGSVFWWYSTLCFILAFVATFLLHIVLQKLRIQ